MTTRRAFLAGTAAVAATGALAACGSSAATTTGAAASQGPVKIRFAWWGNEVRNKMTNQVIADYMKLNPNVTITPEPGEWSGYWDKLSTQYAGKDAPDIIQMDEQYLRDFGKRGVWPTCRSSASTPSSVRASPTPARSTQGVALCAGVNALSIVANPKVSRRPAGDPRPA
jgi:multiple sugar transport system substrate-binding protein